MISFEGVLATWSLQIKGGACNLLIRSGLKQALNDISEQAYLVLIIQSMSGSKRDAII